MRHGRDWCLLTQALALGFLTYAATRLAVYHFAVGAQAQGTCCSVQPKLYTDYLARSWPPGKPIALIAWDLIFHE